MQLKIQPSGNRVRSYLDLVAPDETPSVQLARWTRDLMRNADLHPLPWGIVIGDGLVRFGLDEALLPNWNAELGALLRAALHTRRESRTRRSGR